MMTEHRASRIGKRIAVVCHSVPRMIFSVELSCSYFVNDEDLSGSVVQTEILLKLLEIVELMIYPKS